MKKRLLNSPWVQSFIAFIGSLYIRLIFLTNRWEYVGFEHPKRLLSENKPFITCFWHGRLLLVSKAWPSRNYPFYMLISAHKDGLIISKVVKYFGISTIAGSTRRGGTQALRKVISYLKENNAVGFTPDGPRGPGQHVSEGVGVASYLSQSPILPVTFSTTRRHVFSTWDRFLLAFPFGKGVLMWGAPINPPSKKTEIPQTLRAIQESLDALNVAADNYFIPKC